MIPNLTLSPEKFILAVDVLELMRKIPREIESDDSAFSNPCGFSIEKVLEVRDRFWKEEKYDPLQKDLNLDAFRFMIQAVPYDVEGRCGGQKEWDFNWVLKTCSSDQLIRYLFAFKDGELTEQSFKA